MATGRNVLPVPPLAKSTLCKTPWKITRMAEQTIDQTDMARTTISYYF